MRHFITLISILLSTLSLAANDERDSEIVSLISYRQLQGNKLIITDSVTIQINNRDGADLAHIIIPYRKGEKVDIGDAWIEDMSGNIIRKLKNKEISDRSSISDFSLYEDDFVKEFNLTHNQYPYKIKYSYKTTSSRFFQIASLDYTGKQTPIKQAQIVIETDDNNQIRYKQKNISNPSVEKLNKSIRYTWTYSFEPQKWERYASINDSKEPYLHVVPLNFTYGVTGSFENWQTFGNWIYRLNKGRDILPDLEKQKIDAFTKDITEKREKIRTLYHYLQDYNRYINISLNIGGLQTYPAEYVSNNHYGDCKALTNYMQAMLKYIGIESFYTLINSDNRIEDIDPDFASQAFNHAILTIPVENDTLFLECTSKTLPFGYIHSSIQGRKALLISENTSHLINIPSLKDEDVLCEDSSKTTLNSNDLTVIHTKAIQRGPDFETTNYIISSKNKNTTDKYIRQNIIPNITELVDYSINELSRDSLFIEIEASGNIHNLFKYFGNNISISPISSFDLPTMESISYRKRDIQIDYPYFQKYTETYEVNNTSVSKIPDNITLETKYGNFSLNFDLDGNKILIKKSLLIKSGRYPITEYDKFYDFIQQVRNIQTKKYYIEIL
ncbi:DUF3857 domain-containing protein [Dysgonomonas macrotermitis]|uniref:DUF3857 domain-containing protein n=1 Tax=Dysgonomonas macrotermitis TaxID=1346286 RepID=A0A1M5BTC2_9BACT|nr:DUF3857 domain-containing protein [Dysgonomonas macrotermitis]SHF45517.1 protein of unknown function [Dysgonomonas macrotermitis]